MITVPQKCVTVYFSWQKAWAH